MSVSFSDMQLEVYITNLLWIEVDLWKILILFFSAFSTDDRNGLGEAVCHQIYTDDTASCYKDIYQSYNKFVSSCL